MDRTEEIFCKMLTYNKQDLGVTESPYFITEDILKRGLSAGQPMIMKHLRDFIFNINENRMIVWTDLHGRSFALMHTNRTTLDGSREFKWVETNGPEMPKHISLEYKNPIWITTYRQ